ncbi:MAG: hypothetical protein CFE34_08860 [Rhodobacteraceae bacterium PARR1]|nr:MAG: hypothetical protein CFE34_08860 [Rhodobacteraceae bacterium PARR1]
MRIEYDPVKRTETLALRGIDMAKAGEVLSGPTITFEDVRFDYGEPRFLSVGFIGSRMVIVAWPPRGDIRRIISMRKANDRERARYGQDLRDLAGR